MVNVTLLLFLDWFVTFIDDHSRKVWVYALRTKGCVLEAFKLFQVNVERKTGRSLKCICTDNGGEYRSPFEEYCKAIGIKHESTIPKTPQQNGVAKRMNRKIVERIKCMLSYAKLTKSLWGEAVRTAIDLINLSPSAPLEGDILDKVWTRKHVSYGHLKVFGCRAFVRIPKDEWFKIDDKTKQCVFLGYGHEEFGDSLWDPIDKKVIRSKDMIFFEHQTIEDLEKT